MTLATAPTMACTQTRHGELTITPAGIVGGLTREGWWSLPMAHHPPQGVCDSSVVIDRWLADTCPYTSDTGWGRGHHWTVTMTHTASPVPLPRRGGWRVVSQSDLQTMAERTAAQAAGAAPACGLALLPSWTWWLWVVEWVKLPVADALGVLEYATAHEEGGLSRPLEETTL